MVKAFLCESKRRTFAVAKITVGESFARENNFVVRSLEDDVFEFILRIKILLTKAQMKTSQASY